MLRTKPQQYPMGQYDQQEMRELQQLPSNLTEIPSSPGDSPGHHGHVATVQPAKQRLSSFRTSSEQLQLLQSPTTTPPTKGMHINHSNRNSCGSTKPLSHGDNVHNNVAAVAQALAATTAPSSDTIIRKKLPPKPPSLTVFQGSVAQNALSPGNLLDNGLHNNHHQHQVNTNGNNRRSLKLVQPPSAVKLDFKSDLEAKILKQKEKLKKQQLQLQQQQSTTSPSPLPQTIPVPPAPQQLSCSGSKSNHHSINCNSSSPTSIKSSLKTSKETKSSSTSSASLSGSSSSANASNGHREIMSSSSSASSSPPSPLSSSSSSSSSPPNHSSHTNHNHHSSQPMKHNLNTNSITSTHLYSSKSPLTATPFSKASSIPPNVSTSSSAPSLNVVMPPQPPPLPQSCTSSSSSSMLCNNNTSPVPPSMLANVSKPSITPRPASLSSGLCLSFT